jgi:hypothetical protein
MAKYVHPNMIIDSSAAFLKNVTFDSSVYFQGVTHINAPAAVSSQTPFALVLESGSGTDLQVKSVQLGTMAKENATSWDASLSAIRTDIGNLETSVGALDTLTQSHTTQLGIHNASIGVLTSLTAVHDSSLGFLNAYRLIQDASIAAVGGAWKPYVDGSLATRDSSIIALFAKNAAQDASIVRIDASLNDTIELFDVIDASFQALWDYNAIQDASIAALEAATVNSWNGLTTSVDNSIGLGGTLAQDTIIDASDYSLILGSKDFEALSDVYSYIELDAAKTGVALVAGDGTEESLISVKNDGGIVIDFSGAATINDFGSEQGLVYGGDYSASFVGNSLITKTFAESLIQSAAVNVANGLHILSDGSVGLGGVLLQDTSIATDGQILTFGTGGVGNVVEDGYFIQINDGGAQEGISIQTKANTGADFASIDLGAQAGSAGQMLIRSTQSIDIAVEGGTFQVYGTSGDNITLSPSGIVITSQFEGPGAIYADDYEPYFIARSLVTKQFTESLVGEVSTRLNTAETDISNIETSLGTLNGLINTNTTDISNIETSLGTLNGLINTNTTDITNIETSLGILNSWNVSQDASIVTLRNTTLSALQTANNGLTANDTSVALGGALTHDTDIDATGYTFSVTGGLSVYGTLTVDGSVTYVNSVDLNVSDNIITVNYGETGAGVSKGFAGLKVDRGTEDDYVLVFSEATDTFRIGIANESGLPTGTQAVATREDTPEGFGIPFWNGSLYRFDTSSGFEFTPGVGLSLPIATNDPAEATALMITPAGLVVSRELGTMAFATATDYTLKTLFDSSVAAIWTKFGSVDTSIAGLDTLTQTHTTEINNLESSVGALDLLTQNHTLSISDLSTGKLDAVASTTGITGHEVYSNEADNIAYIKRLIAGTGVSMISDSSTITISADLTSGVLKYKGTFNGTSSTSLSIPAATHKLGIGPLQVTVYDGTDQVWVDVDCAANGDITLEWTGGSLSASCKYIIVG